MQAGALSLTLEVAVLPGQLALKGATIWKRSEAANRKGVALDLLGHKGRLKKSGDRVFTSGRGDPLKFTAREEFCAGFEAQLKRLMVGEPGCQVQVVPVAACAPMGDARQPTDDGFRPADASPGTWPA